MAEYNFPSVLGREFLLELKRMAEDVNVQGKTIQDLVADGQLTEEQYANLINTVNGMLKSGEVDRGDLTPELRSEVDKVRNKIDKGEVSVYDINKNKGKFDQTFLTQDLIDAITGAPGANILSEVAPGSVTTINLANRVITYDKTTFLKRGKNLFNKNNTKAGTTLNSSGEELANSGYQTSAYIYVGGMTEVVATHTINVAQYDAQYNFIEFKGFTAGTPIPINASAAFIRLSVLNTNAPLLQVEEGSVSTTYEDYYEILDGVKVGSQNLDAETQESFQRIPTAKESESIDVLSGSIKEPKNIIDLSKTTDGYALYTSGGTLESANSTVLDYTKIDPEASYVASVTMTVVQYDRNRGHVKGESLTAGNVFVMDANAREIRASFSIANKPVAQLEKGTTSTRYEEYHPPRLQAPKDTVLTNKKVLFIGDSNTHLNAFPSMIAENTGAITFNGGFGGTRLSDLTAVNTTNNYHKLNGCAIADAIAMGDWTTLETAASEIDTAENQNSIPKYSAQLQNIKDACADMSDLHAIVIKYGTNDVNNSNFQLGTTDSLDPTVWNGAINYFVKTLGEAHPHVRVYLCSPVFRLHMPQSEELTGSNKHSDEWAKSAMLPDMADAMRDRAKEHHVPFKDLYNESGINKYTASHYLKPMPEDGTHYTVDGDNLVGQKLEGFLLSE